MQAKKTLRLGSIILLVASMAALLPVLTTEADARQGRGRGRGGRGEDRGGDSRGGGGGSRSRVRREFRLTPTQAGREDGLSGRVRIEARSGRERIDVQVKSDVLPEGTEFEAYAVNPSQGNEPILLGVVTLGVGDDNDRDDDIEGELELKSWDGGDLPAGASPVASITRFFVVSVDTGEVVLESSSSRSR